MIVKVAVSLALHWLCATGLTGFSTYSLRKGDVHPAYNLWRRGVVVSGVRRMNEVNARRARLVYLDG